MHGRAMFLHYYYYLMLFAPSSSICACAGRRRWGGEHACLRGSGAAGGCARLHFPLLRLRPRWRRVLPRAAPVTCFGPAMHLLVVTTEQQYFVHFRRIASEGKRHRRTPCPGELHMPSAEPPEAKEKETNDFSSFTKYGVSACSNCRARNPNCFEISPIVAPIEWDTIFYVD